MIELPEAIVLAKQINQTLKGREIKRAIANYSPHKFVPPCKLAASLMSS